MNNTVFGSKFTLKQNDVFASIVKEDYKKITDKNGEEFIGLRGDIEIFDSNGYHFFMNRWEFISKYNPFDVASFNLLTEICQHPLTIKNCEKD